MKSFRFSSESDFTYSFLLLILSVWQIVVCKKLHIIILRMVINFKENIMFINKYVLRSLLQLGPLLVICHRQLTGLKRIHTTVCSIMCITEAHVHITMLAFAFQYNRNIFLEITRHSTFF